MKGKTILLVEDDDVVRDMIRGGIEGKYNVIEASNCQEAKEKAKKPIDLALIDHNLPDGSGFEVLKMIKAAKPELPVIMMTAYSTENLVIKALRAQVTDYIRKPLNFAYLMGKLREILEGKKADDHIEESVASRNVFVMDRVAAYIEEHYSDDLTRDQLAELAHMDKYQFSRLFNEHFGKDLRSYVNTVRVNKAADILQKSSDLSVSDISYLVGFGSISQFEREFKEAYKTSPSRYQKNRAK